METEVDCKKEKELFFSYMWIFAVGAIFLLLIWWLYYDNKSDKKKIEEARGFYEIIDQINKFSDIVWFNRHKNREYQIMNGEIEVVSSDMYDVYNSKQVLKSIWDGALKSAKQKEAIYGEELYPKSDFELGMINGKLSALRWVL